jgi:hypothetical protein
MPRMIPASFDGTGLEAGVVGVGYGLFGGLIGSSLGSGLSNDTIESMAKAGPLSHSTKDGSAELGVTQGGTDIALNQAVNEHGLAGRVKTRTHVDACPDADGKLTVTIDTESTMTLGGKSGTVKISYRLERWVDDDAHLTDDLAEDFQIDASGVGATGHKVSLVENMTLSRDGKVGGDVTSQQGFDIFHIEDARRTEELRDATLRLMRLVAHAMLHGMKSELPFETGRCVDLQVRADPAKRTAARPNTAYTLFANPRSRLDGAPAGGTVTAKLDGASTLSPTEKVRADARFDYANPAKKNESATVSFEARSRRGVGRATLDFDTKEARAYRIVAGPYTFTACDITKPFDYSPGAGAKLTFTPAEGSGGKSGTMAFRFTGAGGVVNSSYSYTLSGPEDQMTGTLHSTSAVCARAGLSRCYDVQPPTLSSTWTRIDACEAK